MRQLQRWTIALSLVGLCSACGASEPKASSEEAVKPAPTTAVVALGRIEPAGDVIKLSVPNAQDSRVNQILVKEGDVVQVNQVIAVLQGIDRREAELQDAQADVRLRQAELSKTQQGDSKRGEIVAQRATIARLEAQLKAERVQREAAIASADATFQEANLTYQRRQQLQQEGAVRLADLDEAKRDLATATATVRERTADLARTVTTLRAEIAQERARLSELQEVRPVDVQIAQAQLDKAKISVLQRQANLTDAQVRVPVAGQILRINTRVGEQVNTSQGIVELAQTDRMYAIAEIAETDIGKVRKGQRATISSEYGGFAGDIRGVVEHIGLQIGKKSLQDASSDNSPTTDSNARVVTVKIRIDQKDNAKVAARTNMQVRIKLDIAAQPNSTDRQVHFLPGIDYDAVAFVND